MKTVAEFLQAVAITLWIGGLWVIGLLVAPMLFQTLTDRSLAGALAGRFFATMAWIGLGCGLYLLVYRLQRFGGQALRQLFFWLVLLMLVLTATGHFGVQPILASLRQQDLSQEVMQSLLRERFAVWHGVASVMFLIQCVLGLAVVALHGRGR
jgi:hypothetical protein